eukprot:TRINITY_DN12586_c0_g1_i3.p1 TRINITY_DN12586_c0_g1~~TRINITY_DN12586_c0_g1_i3.p1  ORF type:complete len:407 (+),score=-16.11 TRINITY_DN12586_c0_g1_i3:176-1222(+)
MKVLYFMFVVVVVVQARKLLVEESQIVQDSATNYTKLGEQIEQVRQVVLQQLDYDDSWHLDWNTLCKSYVNANVSYDVINFFAGLDIYRTVVTLLFICILSYGVIFLIVHKLLQKMIQVYDSFDSSQQFIVSFHVVMYVVLGIQVFTHSWIMILFFYADPVRVLIEHNWLFLSLSVSHIILYTVELIVRAVIRVQPAIFLHHCMFMSYLLLLFTNPSIFILQNEHIVDWMVVFEFLLYAGNICYRTCGKTQKRLVQNVIIGGLVLYVLSRIVQIMMLTQHFVCTDAPKNHVYWILVVFAFLLVSIQLYTFFPYVYMYNNAGKAQIVLNRNSSDTNASQGCSSGFDSQK